MFAFSPVTFRRIVRASAAYDVVVTAMFATPWTFTVLLAHLSAVNQQLGGQAVPPFDTFGVLIACLLGSVVMVWSVLRLRDPQALYGRFDAATRLLFSTWMAWALVQTQAPVLWLFVVPELAWGVVQLWPLVEQRGAGGPAQGQGA